MTTFEAATAAAGEQAFSQRRYQALRNFLRSRAALFGGAVVALLLICAVFAPWLAPHDPRLQNLNLGSLPPIWAHGGKAGYWLGTDELGRDILSRIIYGARLSATVAFSVVIIGSVIGVSLGLISGYVGGWIDDVIMRIADIQLAFPYVLLAIAVIGVVGANVYTIIGVIGVTSWVQYVRVVRSEVISLREREFVQAAHAIGCAPLRIIFRHVLPNVTSSVTVIATFELARAIIFEAALSFLGLGVSPATPSWGNMLAEGRQYLDTAWWMGTFPGLAIMLTVLGVNVLGDGLRDALDPSLMP
ncbi:MAG TPA: ABC transporter permease [Candidatus Dormibacteraeota bacterium]|nr:ABC transporter permease [Candidatus Dormibacteraeota bacterium]